MMRPWTSRSDCKDFRWAIVRACACAILPMVAWIWSAIAVVRAAIPSHRDIWCAIKSGASRYAYVRHLQLIPHEYSATNIMTSKKMPKTR